MVKYLHILLIILFSIQAKAEVQILLEGDIVQYISEIRSAMPGMGSNKFVIPQDSDLASFQTTLTNLKSQNFSTIESTLFNYNYTFYFFTDQSSYKRFYILKENIPISLGWGSYIYNPEGRNNMTIEVPHPIWDTNSWELAIKVFVKLDARWFIMAGTHRYANIDSSSDMAHVTQSVFHKAHQIAATARAIQVHGFNRSNTVYNGYPEIVISNGTLSPPDELYTLKTNYEAMGFTAGVYSRLTSSNLSRLGATTNTQGRWSNVNGKTFIHIEYDYPIRTNSSNMDKAIAGLFVTYKYQNNPEPKEFILHQNYPNPFNPKTTIEFSIPDNMKITFKIFDLTGRVVSVLLDRYLEKGPHKTEFETTGLSSGMLIYQIQGDGWCQSKKMLIIK